MDVYKFANAVFSGSEFRILMGEEQAGEEQVLDAKTEELEQTVPLSPQPSSDEAEPQSAGSVAGVQLLQALSIGLLVHQPAGASALNATEHSADPQAFMLQRLNAGARDSLSADLDLLYRCEQGRCNDSAQYVRPNTVWTDLPGPVRMRLFDAHHKALTCWQL